LSKKIIIISEYNLHIKHKTEWLEWFKGDDSNFPTTFMRLSNLRLNENALLNVLLKKGNPSNLLLLTTISDLISNDIMIRQGLSWEVIVKDLIKAAENGVLADLKPARFLIVLINRSGAFLIDNSEQNSSKYTLFWSHRDLEDDNKAKDQGDMRGLHTGLLVNVLKNCIEVNQGDLSLTAVEEGIRQGLEAMEIAYDCGFSEEEKDDGSKFPLEEIIWSNENGDKSFNCEKFAIPNSTNIENWSILSEWIRRKGITKENIDPLIQLVIEGEDLMETSNDEADKEDRVLFGDKCKLPYARFGQLKVINKKEIQEFRAIKRLIYSYLIKNKHTKPLSLAVFGDPGSGKSFGIKQIVESFTIRKPKILYYNLSQFQNKGDLVNAFQKIRDEAIKGNVVLVFWDEFDTEFKSNNFGWVKYFLAPMQDGKFYVGSASHNIGPAIFVFIGSQCTSMEAFTNHISGEKTNLRKNHATKAIKDKHGEQLSETQNTSNKLKDFISRLQGHLDIQGINPKINPTDENELIEVYLRRAIILRAILLNHCRSIISYGKDGKETLSIEEDLVRSFLTTNEYQHGVRSMESIVLMSHIDGRSRYNRSCLPSKDQLELHIDPSVFFPKD
jgi:hypothetical protein